MTTVCQRAPGLICCQKRHEELEIRNGICAPCGSGTRKALHSVHVTSYFDVKWGEGGRQTDRLLKAHTNNAHTVWLLFVSMPQVRFAVRKGKWVNVRIRESTAKVIFFFLLSYVKLNSKTLLFMSIFGVDA